MSQNICWFPLPLRLSRINFWVFGLVLLYPDPRRGHRAKSQTDRKPAVTGKDRWRPNSKSLDHEPSVFCPVVMSQNPGTQTKPWFPNDTWLLDDYSPKIW